LANISEGAEYFRKEGIMEILKHANGTIVISGKIETREQAEQFLDELNVVFREDRKIQVIIHPPDTTDDNRFLLLYRISCN